MGLLDIISIDSQGNLTATAFGDKITDSFNEVSGEIVLPERLRGHGSCILVTYRVTLAKMVLNTY